MSATRVIDGVRFSWDGELHLWEMCAELDYYDVSVLVEDSEHRRSSRCSISITHRQRDERITASCNGLSRVRAVRNAWCYLHPWLHEELWVKQCGGKP